MLEGKAISFPEDLVFNLPYRKVICNSCVLEIFFGGIFTDILGNNMPPEDISSSSSLPKFWLTSRIQLTFHGGSSVTEWLNEMEFQLIHGSIAGHSDLFLL